MVPHGTREALVGPEILKDHPQNGDRALIAGPRQGIVQLMLEGLPGEKAGERIRQRAPQKLGGEVIVVLSTGRGHASGQVVPDLVGGIPLQLLWCAQLGPDQFPGRKAQLANQVPPFRHSPGQRVGGAGAARRQRQRIAVVAVKSTGVGAAVQLCQQSRHVTAAYAFTALVPCCLVQHNPWLLDRPSPLCVSSPPIPKEVGL